MGDGLLAAGAAACAVLIAIPGRTHRLGRLAGLGDARSLVVARAMLSRLMTLVAMRGRVARRRQQACEAVAAMAAELRAGQPVHRALERACAGTAVAGRARAALRWGGDVPAALRDDARSPGCEVLRSVAACWTVAAGRGAGLAQSLERLVDAERAAEEVRAQLSAHLAAPRATARMLAGLPLLGLLLGIALGGDPLAWMLGTPMGLACLVGGGLLTALGLLWTSRIAARVERLL